MSKMPKRDANGRFVSSASKKPRNRKKPARVVQATPPARPLINRFVICLDASGSMDVLRRNAIEAFNKNVASIVDGANKSGQLSTVSLYTFARNASNEKYFDVQPSTLRQLTEQDYRPFGGTPLFDCVGDAINRLSALPDSPDVSYIFIVITDGEENTSTTFNRDTLSKLIREKNATDRWTFAFLVPPGYKARTVAALGLEEGNVQEWQATTQGMNFAAQNVSYGINQFYTARSMGKSAVRGFFTTDLSKINAKTVQRTLNDVRGKVSIWNVDKGEVEIRAFVEGRGIPYQKGSAYYQLTKDELVQASKQVILVEKGKGTVYAGDDARHLLNLPNYNVKVRPGNHANWDVFVQSTSTNRKLVRGTKLVYMP